MARSRLVLVLGVFVYLGLAGISAVWLPAYPFIAWTLVFFSLHTAAYLVAQEIRGH